MRAQWDSNPRHVDCSSVRTIRVHCSTKLSYGPAQAYLKWKDIKVHLLNLKMGIGAVYMQDSFEKKLVELNRPVRERLASLFDGRERPWEVYGLLSEFLSSEGKLLRPALCLSACGAVGGNAEDAVPAAAAIEMFHNFTLIHDDIEDDSKMRRGHPCMHVKYGLPLALNAGDGLFMMVWRETLRIPGARREEAQKRLLAAFTQVLEGQAIELGWYQSKKWDVDEKEYYRVVEGKTGALIAGACEVGALLGGADAKTCRQMRDFGMGIGVGFQIIDDVLNIAGNVEKYGKEIGGDITEGKRTLMTIRASQMLPAQKSRKLGVILKKETKTAKDVEAAVALLKESGAVESATRSAEEITARAMGNLESLAPNPGRVFLGELAQYITMREK